MPDSTEVPTIKQLVNSALDGGKTLRKLETASGGRVKYQTFQKYATGEQPKAFPESETIKGFADALEVTETAVVLAIAKSLGITIEAESGFAMQLPRGIDQLDDEMQRAILAVARAAVRRLGVDQPQDGRNSIAPEHWRLPPDTPSSGQPPGVGRDEDGNQRHNLGG